MKKHDDKNQVLETEKLHATLAETQASLARALADYQNLQRHTLEEKQAFAKFATQGIVVSLLPILDQLDQAVTTAPEGERGSVWLQAVTMSVGQLKELLVKQGIAEINPEHEQFDPNMHEAVDAIAGDDDNKVAQVLHKGYSLHGKVVVPARVQVIKKSI